MKTENFEKAVDALQGDVMIDEVIIGMGSQVKAVYGHDRHAWVKWDSFGRSFTCHSEEEIPLVPQNPRLEVEYDGDWERDVVYDLKFE